MDVEIIERVWNGYDNDFKSLKKFNTAKPLPLVNHSILLDGEEYKIEHISHIISKEGYDFTAIELIVQRI